jgi:hypothetical protein
LAGLNSSGKIKQISKDVLSKFLSFLQCTYTFLNFFDDAISLLAAKDDVLLKYSESISPELAGQVALRTLFCR